MISHKYKFAMIGIPKTGSTSIRTALSKYFDIHSEPEWQSPYYHHTTARDLKQQFAKMNWCWDDYHIFTFVRNPFSRVVSEWNYAHQVVQDYEKYDGDQKVRGPWGGKLCPTHSEYEQKIKIVNMEDFKVFCNRWVSPWQTLRNWCTCDNESIIVDYIGKFENIQQDFNSVCDTIGIPHQQLPHRRKSTYKHYTEYYDDETRSIVAEKYAKDIEYFGYKFGE